MAVRLLHLRRTLTLLSSTLQRPLSTPVPIPPSSPQSPTIISRSQVFTGTRGSMMSTTTTRPEKKYKLYEDGDEITEDTILFPGCDYNHWLITVDFPKEPKPSPEEMVATYERICAQGLNISIEEAKMKIYACSTTTYQGFQALMSEQESEKFKDVPGVVFVLPDSYIDPVNKEYGGDKYENGVITPRPPPVHRGGERRYDRNRSPPRFNQQGGPMPNHQGPPPQYSQQGHMQGGGSNYGPRQNYPPQQNHGPPMPGGSMPMNNRDHSPGGRNTNQGQQGSLYPLGQQGYNQGQQGNLYPPGQQGYNQGQQGNLYPPGQQGYNQGQQGNHYAPDQRSFLQGDLSNHGSPGPRDYRGGDRNYSPTRAGNYGQVGNTGIGQHQLGDGQRSAQMEQRSMQGEQGNYAPTGQPGWSDQARHPPIRNFGQGGNTGYGQRNLGEGPRSTQMEQRSTQGEQGNYAPTGKPGWSDKGGY
ncbi:MULTIPLE ORGANELLAR RNA EDITING FACTOR 2 CHLOROPLASTIC-RELATED-RELATED [Salix koriyanagi]|uniref:MULTIPLE ORGANELLAR RNA EDITING FACTOR 2 CHLOROPLASTIC-RELATED-RELATED n=1 Tax=Salix koriyanagi TaxID=2511006 RepID=A0A9Q0PYK8_9ROSI|nr:MULTIPLE ORGANELLAR RNA EDITING FACTOR 2 CHLOROPLASTIC-RELATED-RELATED [Salix koriyanagi]